MDDLPIGFAMTLSEHPESMEYFVNLDHKQKEKVIERTKTINSNEEMHNFVIGMINNMF